MDEQGIYTSVSVIRRNILTRVSKKDTVGYLKTSMAHRKDVVASIRRLESTCRALETPAYLRGPSRRATTLAEFHETTGPLCSPSSFVEGDAHFCCSRHHPRFIRLIRPLILECLPAGLSAICSVRFLEKKKRGRETSRVAPWLLTLFELEEEYEKFSKWPCRVSIVIKLFHRHFS